MEKAFDFGEGLHVNGCIIFPTDLNKENLLKFTFLLLENFSPFQKENIELQIRTCFDQKSIEWQVKTFHYDKGFCLDKTYTFCLLPDWTLNLMYEHWTEVNNTLKFKRSKELEQDNENFGEIIKKFLDELTYYYTVVGTTATNHFLNTANWKVIYARSIKEEQEGASENRIQEYLKFFTRSISNFKN